jgi:Flp pilus assembly protein TadD
MQRTKVLIRFQWKAPFYCLLWLSVLCHPAAAEEITFKSGSKLTAKITEYACDHIKVDLNGVALTYYKDDIQSISNTQTSTLDTLKPPIQNPDINITQLIEKVAATVVVIEAKKDNKVTTQGTGFFVSPDGLVATNLHVIFKASSIRVRTKDNQSYPVEFIANYSDELDICLLKINIDNAPVLPLGNSETLKQGQILFTIRHREGARYETSSGPFLGKRTLDGTENLQTKMITGHGNSGGPILDQEGRIVGISKAFSPENGHNFGIPINIAKEFLAFHNPITVTDFDKHISPANALTYFGQGALLEKDYVKALENFKQALSLDPNYLKAWIGLAKVYSTTNRSPDALSSWQEVIKRDPSHLGALMYIGKDYLNRNMLDEAISYLQKVVDLAPQTHEVYQDLGFAYGQKGLLNEAINTYKKAIELDPQDASSHFNLAVAYFNKRDFITANSYCQKAKNLGYAIPETFLTQLEETKKFGNTFLLK